jgi:parallel beta-helix repeat protein
VATGVFPAADGTPTERTNYLIENNRIHDRDGIAIDLTDQNYSTVRNNVIFNLPTAMVLEGTAGLTWPYTYNDHVRIFNNTFVVTYAGIAVYDSRDSTIKNNLISGYGGAFQLGKSYNAPASNTASDYNILIQAGTFSSGWVEGVHSLYLPPGTVFFVDPSTENIRLTSTSPAIDRGVDLSITGFATDYEGISRPSNAWDIGAAQFR